MTVLGFDEREELLDRIWDALWPSYHFDAFCPRVKYGCGRCLIQTIKG